MKIKMNKIAEETVKGCFCHFDNCGRLYLGRHQNDGFWICKDEHSLSLIPADVSLPVQEITCCDPDGDELSGHQLKLTGNAIYAVSNSGIYKRDISNGKIK
nr:hypothetical protein [Bacillus siamensis]